MIIKKYSEDWEHIILYLESNFDLEFLEQFNSFKVDKDDKGYYKSIIGIMNNENYLLFPIK